MNSATLASLNSTDVYDSDGIAPRESPPLQQKTLKLRITPSPPPKVTEVSRSSKASSPSTSRHRSSSNRRRKAKPSLGQTVLLQYMTGGRNPDIARFESEREPSDDSDSEDEEDDQDDNIGRTRESTSEFINNDSDSDKDNEENEHGAEEDGSRRRRRDISLQNHNRLFLGESSRRKSPNSRPLRLDQQQRPIRSEEQRGRSLGNNTRQEKPNRLPESDNGDDAMSLDEPSPPPQRPQQQPQPHERGHESDKTQQRGQDHERPKAPSTEARPPFVDVNLAAIALAATGIAVPRHGSSAESTEARTTSSTEPYSAAPLHAQSELPPPPPRSPGAKRDHDGALKPMSIAPGTLRVDSSISSPHPHYGRTTGSMDAPGSRSGGSLSPEQMRRQYSSPSQNAMPAYSPRPGSIASHQDQQSDQSQLLTPASAITPGAMSASSTTFPPIIPRDDRSVVGSTGAASLATPSSTHSPNDYHSPFSPSGAGMAVSPSQVSAMSPPRSQADFISFPLQPLPPIQPYSSPRHDNNSVASPMSANTPAGHTPSNHSSNGSVGQSQHNLLPPIREHLAGPLTESSPTGSDGRRPPPPFLPPSTGYTRLPSMSHSHHSSPTSPGEMYRRNSDLASPNSAPQYYAPSAPSSYSGSRRGTVEYGADTPTSEPHYGTPGSTGRPAASPGRLLNPMAASPLPGPIVLPPVRHDSTMRQQPSFESLTSHMQPHSPNSQQIPPMQQKQQQQQQHHQQGHLLTPPPPLPPQHQQQQAPPQQSHTTAQGPYKCDVPGCTAAPFPTQYLLNSHANVHSSVRLHYCPVRGCPRSETGKGFKRKNEMIRHGLVHQSPGYVCPFCPDREHKYPRPDNLQRHVRVHHKDKHKEDPLLREVLAQRAEGPSRGRRRRL